MNDSLPMVADLGLTPEQLRLKWKPTWDFVTERCFTWTEDHTLAYLAEQARKCELIAENGVYMGASSLMMMEATINYPTQLFAVDPFMVAGTEKVTRWFLKEHIERGKCHVRAMYSAAAVEGLTAMGLRGKFDMVFVDDGHAYSDVCYDIDCWLPMLRPGGLICGHDYETEVKRAVLDKLPNPVEPVPRLWAYVKP